MRMIQLLPLYDTCAHPHQPWLDASPYAAISAHALNPVYLRLSELPDLPKDLTREIRLASERLNARTRLGTQFACFTCTSRLPEGSGARDTPRGAHARLGGTQFLLLY